MKSYYLVIYKKSLSKHQKETISDLCGGAEIVEPNEDSQRDLLCGYDLAYDGRYEGAYRIITEVLPPIALMTGNLPLYVGVINLKFEDFCRDAVYHFIQTNSIFKMLDGMQEDLEILTHDYDCYFDQESHIDMESYEIFKEHLHMDLETIRSITRSRFEQHRFNLLI
jgi:hypothetical protein